MSNYHLPVLLEESIRALDIQPDQHYIDATYGGGGHSQEILKNLDKGKLFAFDRDFDAQSNNVNHPNLQLIRHDYRWVSNFLEYHTAVPVHGILADLGVSSHQFDNADRGFSFRQDAPLDMRMDKDIETHAGDILADYSPHQLQQIFTRYGEIKNAKSLAEAVVNQRKLKPIKFTRQLLDILDQVMHRSDKKSKYYSQVFQALRIEVNQELQSLELFLNQCADLLCEGGKLVVITYHSLEDRLVKNLMNKGNLEGKEEKDFYGNLISPYKTLTRKPILPTAQEIERNPRARSAKLRIAEKVHEQA